MRQINTLTGIRFFAALWVSLYHITPYLYFVLTKPIPLQKYVDPRLPVLFSHGYLGVDVFFVLSGFILSYTYWHIFEKEHLGASFRFLLNRVARIYPAFLFVFIVGAVLMMMRVTILPLYSVRHVANFILSLPTLLTLTFSWFHPTIGSLLDAFWTANPPLWSISAEWAAYLVFPLLFVFVKFFRLRFLILIALLLIAYLQVFLYFSPTYFDHTKLTSLSYYIYGFPMLARLAADFFAGITTYLLWKTAVANYKPVWNDVACVLLMVLLFLILERGLWITLVIPTIAAFLFFLSKGTAFFEKLLGNRFVVYLGEISYSYYLMHYLVLQVVFVLYMHFGLNVVMQHSIAMRIAVLSVFLLSTILIAMGVYHGVEKPGRRFIRNLSNS